MHVHLVTAGTSIITNALREELPKDIAEVLRRARFAEPGSPQDLELRKHTQISSRVFNEVYGMVFRNPYLMSAELNSLKYFIERGLVDKVVLLSTDTGAGYFCSIVIEKYLSRAARLDAETKVVKGFGVDFEEGLLNLLDVACKLIHDYKRGGHEVYVCATAGFKPETTFLVIASFLLDVDKIYYIHENFREHVEIPAIPITVKKDYLDELLKIRDTEELHGFLPADHIREDVLRELQERHLVSVEGSKKVRLKKWIKVILRYLE